MWYSILDRVGEWVGYTPKNSQALIRRGNRALSRNDLGNAQWYYMKALEAAPRKAGSFFELGAAILYRSFPPFFPIGIEALQRALELAPSHTIIRNHLGVLFAMSGRVEEAREQFEQVLFYDAANTDAHINLGNLFFKLQLLERAAQEFEKAVQASPQHFEAHLNLALTLQMQGELQAALQRMEQASKLRPKRLELQVLMARIHFQRGDLQSAQWLLRQFLKATDKDKSGAWEQWRLEAIRVLQGADWSSTVPTEPAYVQGSRVLPQFSPQLMRQKITGQHKAVEVSWQPTPPMLLTGGSGRLHQTPPPLGQQPTLYDSNLQNPTHLNGQTLPSTPPREIYFGAPRTFSPEQSTLIEYTTTPGKQ